MMNRHQQEIILNIKKCSLFLMKNSKISNKAKTRNQYNQVPHLTQDTTWKSDKNTRKHHIQESQEVSPFPAGDHKAEMNRQECMKNTKHKWQKKSTKEARHWNSQLKRFLLEGLNLFYGTNLNLIFDVDKYK